jgi:hypothetical protein
VGDRMKRLEAVEPNVVRLSQPTGRLSDVNFTRSFLLSSCSHEYVTSSAVEDLDQVDSMVSTFKMDWQ